MKGRPSTYSEDIATDICVRLSEGESLRAICRDDSMPALSTVFLWLTKHPDFSEQYARAKDESADAYAEKITEVADGVLAGSYEPQAARVAMDGYKWTAARLKPKKYGDRQQLEHSGPNGGAITVTRVELVAAGDDDGKD